MVTLFHDIINKEIKVYMCHNSFLGYSPIHIFSLFKTKYTKNIAVKRGCQNALKRVKNWLRMLKNTKIEI
jgi:hypothetical protein